MAPPGARSANHDVPNAARSGGRARRRGGGPAEARGASGIAGSRSGLGRSAPPATPPVGGLGACKRVWFRPLASAPRARDLALPEPSPTLGGLGACKRGCPPSRFPASRSRAAPPALPPPSPPVGGLGAREDGGLRSPAPETLEIRSPTPPAGQTGGGSWHSLHDWYNDRGQAVANDQIHRSTSCLPPGGSRMRRVGGPTARRPG